MAIDGFYCLIQTTLFCHLERWLHVLSNKTLSKKMKDVADWNLRRLSSKNLSSTVTVREFLFVEFFITVDLEFFANFSFFNSIRSWQHDQNILKLFVITFVCCEVCWSCLGYYEIPFSKVTIITNYIQTHLAIIKEAKQSEGEVE